MKILNLVTTRRPFFRAQCRSLEERGIQVETIEVPGREETDDHRSITDYIQFVLPVLRYSFSNHDIIHANFGLTAPFALLHPHRPIVLSLWGSDLAGKYGPVTKLCTRFCDEVIVRSEEMRHELGRDAHVIPAGIDLEQFKPKSKIDAQRMVGWDSSKKHVLFPYSPSRSVKNYPLAEQVVERVDNECSDEVRLQTVYGIDHDDIPVYMNAADALLLTSHREGSPNTVKEAMGCNLPVVATDVGDVRERLQDVDQSEVCETEIELVNSLASILQADEPSNGREHVQDVCLERMGERLEQVYQKAL